jgi:hypothetical protein
MILLNMEWGGAADGRVWVAGPEVFEIGEEDDGLGASGENGGAKNSQLTGKKKRLFQSIGGWIHLLLIVIIIDQQYHLGRLENSSQRKLEVKRQEMRSRQSRDRTRWGSHCGV